VTLRNEPEGESSAAVSVDCASGGAIGVVTGTEQTTPSKRELVQVTAWSVVYETHSLELVRFATMLVGRSDAPDVVSAVFASMLRSTGWDRVTNQRAYLFKAVANEARNLTRGQSRREQRERRDHLMRDFTSIPASETPLDVRRSVAQLSDQQRAVIFLAYWADLPEADIASTLDISTGSVRRHLARAKTHLRRSLHD